MLIAKLFLDEKSSAAGLASSPGELTGITARLYIDRRLCTESAARSRIGSQG
jgi:hypothetical protein